jgi:hypothetical protein
MASQRTASPSRIDNWPPPPGRRALRALLLCLFVPALVMDADSRGLHDRAARSVVVKDR